MKFLRNHIIALVVLLIGVLASCARMGNPDGGWYDEIPPRVVSASPADRGTGVKSNKVQIYFNEFIKLENAIEKVVISPPQMEMPEIKATGKRIVVELKDTLKESTTYTIDFSDAISDNNENNPMGNYTYSFSTGDEIDTLEVSGIVLGAEDLEPVKGILVGLTIPDSVGGTMQRVSRTDSHGRFIIRGIAPGEYCCYALNDQDGNYRFSQRSEQLAFNHDVFSPYCRPDTRQDTIWTDTLHIKDIHQVGYTHFFPDDITLLAFTHDGKDRFYLKTDRTDADRFTVFFSGPGSYIPKARLLDAPAGLPHADEPFVIETTARFDTITYWLRDTMLVNTDSLNVEITYETLDTLGNMIDYTDTLLVLSKTPYAKRLKQHLEEVEKFEKKLAKLRKKGEEPKDTIFPVKPLEPKYALESSMAPDGIIRIELPKPLERFDTSAVHLYCMKDSMWFRAPFRLIADKDTSIVDKADTSLVRKYIVTSDWMPGTEYSFEVDTLAFTDIYGLTSAPYKTGFKIRTLEEYASLFVNVTGVDADSVVVQLLDKGDKVVMTSVTSKGTAEFYYVKPGTYFMRAFVDRNGNGKWDTGNFYEDRQPEPVYYYNDSFECKAKWDLTKNWNLTTFPVSRQKPSALVKQKGDKKKTIRLRNAERARQKGIEVPDYLKQ